MFTVKDQFGYVQAVCLDFDNAVKAAKKFTLKDMYASKSAYIFDIDGLEIYSTSIASIEDEKEATSLVADLVSSIKF